MKKMKLKIDIIVHISRIHKRWRSQMPYNFKVKGKIGIVSTEPEEPITNSSAERFFSEIVDLAGSASVSKILIDARKIRVDLNVMQRFDFGEKAAQIFRGLKIAFVTEPPLYDPRHFGEIVAYNRGAHIREFQTVEEAMLWLE
jgi:hypothetical protein